MTNLKKCLGVTTFAVLALAFCCLIIGQAAIARVDKAVRADDADKSFESAVPLPTVHARGGQAGSALSSPDPYLLTPLGLDENPPWPAKSLDKISIYNKHYSPPSGMVKQGGDVIPGVDITGPLPIQVFGNTCGYADDYEEACPYDAAAPDVVYAFTAAGPGGAPYQYIDLSLCNPGTNYDTKMFVYDSEENLIACNDDDPADPGYRSSLYGVTLASGSTYYIIIDGYGNGCGDYELTIVGGPDPYDCAEGDIDEGETCGTHVNDWPTPGTIGAGETICGTLYAEDGVRDSDYFQYTVTAELGEELTFTAISDFDASWYIMLYGEDVTLGYYTYSIAGGPFEEVQIPYFLMPPGTYTIRIVPNLAPESCYGYDCGTNPADPTNGNYRYKLTLDVTIPEPWDDCNLAEEIFDGMNDFDLTGATPGGGLGWGPNAWYAYEATGNGIATFRICADQAIAEDEDLFVFLAWNQCWDPDGYANFAYNGGWVPWDCLGGDGPMSFAMPMMEGDVMYLEVTSYFAAYDYTGTIEVDLKGLEALNDICVNAEDLGTGEMLTPLFIHNFAANTDGVLNFEEFQGFASRCAVGDMGADVWYTWTADMDGWAMVSTCDPDGWDGKLEVYEGFECTGQDPEDEGYRLPLACGDDDCDAEGNGVMPAVEFPTVVGGEYLFRLGGWAAEGGAASQGVSWMTIETSAAPFIARPPNDNCADITPPLLDPGMETQVFGDCVDGSNHDCLMLAPTVWEAFEIDFCANVRISYCPTEVVEEALSVTHAEGYEHEDGYYYITDRLLLTGCPCMGVIWTSESSYNWTECDEGHRTEYYNSLVPGTYYFPILPGWHHGPDYGVPGSGFYGLGFLAEEVECVHCDALANINTCPDLVQQTEVGGATWITNVDLADLSKVGVPYVQHVSNDCNSYEDHTDMIANLYRGISYDFDMVFDKVGALSDYDICDIWVDWNQNSGFLDPGDRFTAESFVTGSSPNYTFHFGADITPPLDAMGPGEGATGFTLMRVRLASTADGNNSPCGEKTFGEVEDFTIEVKDLECGDFFGDGVGADDIEFLRDWYFGGTSAPDFWQRADIDGDGVITIADVIALVDAAYHGGDLICL